jgi:hypothetical protein
LDFRLVFPNAKSITLVHDNDDNLSIHAKASPYQGFPAAEARV